MHAGQVEIDPDALAEMVVDQFPQWRGLPVTAVPSHGTVNALYRLGEDIVLRLPLLPGTDPGSRESLQREQNHARMLESHVLLQVPEPLAIGAPGPAYQGWWSAYRWIAGEPLSSLTATNVAGLPLDLARFVLDLHGIDTQGHSWNGRSRGGPLSSKDSGVRQALRESEDLTDTAAVARIWERCLGAAGHSRPDVWLHADLMPGNLLIAGGRLAAVLDLGAVCVGDPAVDLMPAWNLLDADQRVTFRRALDVDDATWERGRGWAIAQAIIALP